MVSLGRRTWLKSVYTKPLSSSLKEAMHPLFEWYLIHKEWFFWSYTDFLKKKCSAIYDAKPRPRYREGCPFVLLSRRDKTKALIWMVLIPMFFLVSFGFESLPLPVGRASFSVALSPSLTRLLIAVILDFLSVCRGKYLTPTFLHLLLYRISSGLYKTEWKARVEAQTKGERKSRKERGEEV